jgi:hypothetical protein
VRVRLSIRGGMYGVVPFQEFEAGARDQGLAKAVEALYESRDMIQFQTEASGSSRMSPSGEHEYRTEIQVYELTLTPGDRSAKMFTIDERDLDKVSGLRSAIEQVFRYSQPMPR